ncbi:MAG: hypothetical protein PHG07_01385 [Lachnospiraceae bacterium]|nr:hypothetical protein [Lachnospiraceae bacterium]
MTTDRDTIDAIIYDRMFYHSENREECMKTDEIEEFDECEKAFFCIIETLDVSDKHMMESFLDSLSSKYSRINEFYFRKGLEDGVKLERLIQSWKGKK